MEYLERVNQPVWYPACLGFSTPPHARVERGQNEGDKGSFPPVEATIANFSHTTGASLPPCRVIEGHADC